LTRLNHQVALCEAVAGRIRPVELAAWLQTAPQRLVEKALYMGARERVAVRLVAVRVPGAIVSERRRKARVKAKKRGYTPSQTHLALLAWKLFVTNVPGSVWTPATISKAYSLRWQAELVFKSWKSDLHLAPPCPPPPKPPLFVICMVACSSLS